MAQFPNDVMKGARAPRMFNDGPPPKMGALGRALGKAPGKAGAPLPGADPLTPPAPGADPLTPTYPAPDGTTSGATPAPLQQDKRRPMQRGRMQQVRRGADFPKEE